MSGRTKGMLALIAGGIAVAAVAALSMVLGEGATPAAAQSPTPTIYAYIDKNIENGAGACDPNAIDDETTEYLGTSHQLAVCVDNLPDTVYAFALEITYDDTLDSCQDEICEVPTNLATAQESACTDDNPDANTGQTVWRDGLGEDWTCQGVRLAGGDTTGIADIGPACDVDEASGPGRGRAVILCQSNCADPGEQGPATAQEGCATLGDDEEWGALAVLTLDVVGIGTDNVEIARLNIADEEFYTMGSCGDEEELSSSAATAQQLDMPCLGATDHKIRRTGRATETPTSTATSVPSTATPVPPTATKVPPTSTPSTGAAGTGVKPPATGTGGTSSLPWQLWTLVGGAAVAVAAATALTLDKSRR